MKTTRQVWRSISAIACASSLIPTGAFACTDVLLKTANQLVVSGRNMDYPTVFRSKVLITPEGKPFQSPAPAGVPALGWAAHYGYVGVTGGTNFIADGMNEKGLTISKQDLAATRMPAPVADRPNLEIKLFCDWVLGNFSSIDEVEKALPSINPIETKGGDPVHFALHDRDGNSAVIEFTQGETKLYRNPNGVLTNGPSFEWQMTHLRYFKWEKSVPDSALPVPTGYFPAERFIRASIMRDALPAAETPQMAVANALRVLDGVAPLYGMPGTYRQEDRNGGEAKPDFTQWTVVRDQSNLVYYYKSYDNPGLKAVELGRLDLSGKTDYEPLPVGDGTWFQPAPMTAKPDAPRQP